MLPTYDASPDRRRALRLGASGLIAAAGLATVGLAGCGSAASGGDSGGTAAGYPIRIPGKFGTTTIENRPARVVALSDVDADAAIALGVIPVGYGNHIGEIQPWTARRLGSGAGSAKPKILKVEPTLPIEQVAALRPELILATNCYSLPKDHAALAKLAPVLTYQQAPNSDTWQANVRRIGMALGRTAAADTLIADVDARTKATKAKFPTLAGKTFALLLAYSYPEMAVINNPKDFSALFMTSLGLKLAPSVAGLPPMNGYPGRSSLSRENFDVLQADILIANADGPPRRKLLADPLFTSLPAVRQKHLALIQPTLAQSIGFPSALSVPYALENLAPLLGKAATGS